MLRGVVVVAWTDPELVVLVKLGSHNIRQFLITMRVCGTLAVHKSFGFVGVRSIWRKSYGKKKSQKATKRCVHNDFADFGEYSGHTSAETTNMKKITETLCTQ